MRKTLLNQTYAFALAGLLAVALTGCTKQPGATQENVATVNGEAIPLKEYYSYLERKQTVQVMTPQGPQEAQVASMLGFQALRDVIQNRLLLQLAKEDGVLPTDADVQKEIERLEKQQGSNFVSSLVAQGVSLDQIKEGMRLSLARQKLITKGITVTMPEVDNYVKANPQQFMEPERAKVRLIVVRDATKKALVDKDLKSGQDFQMVAIRYSEAPQARQTGGMLDTDIVQQFPPMLQDLVKKTPVQKTTDWVQNGAEWVKFYIQEKTPAKPMQMTEDRKLEVQRQLALERGSRANDLAKRISDKMRVAKVEVGPKNLRDLWDRAFEQAKNELAQQEAASRSTAPAPTSGGTSTTGTTPPGAAPPKTTG